MSNIKENKMGVMPVNKLLITMSLPIMVSMLVQAAYNIVDSIFVSMIHEDALTALSLAFPVQNLMIGVATGTGVGMNSLLSKSLGEKNTAKANKAAANGVFLCLLSSVVFLLFGIFGSEFFFRIQTDNERIIEYGTQYISICSICSVFVFMQVIFERLMQSTGKTVYSMFTQGAGAITNIILDPILIFGLGFIPAMGVVGAALATVIGQAVACFMGIFLNHKYNKEIKLSFKGFKPDGKTIKRIYSVGVPSMIMVGIGSLMNFALNNMLISFFSTTAAAVLGAYYKLQSFAFMPVFGLNNGVIPIIAYNYGARKRERLTKCIKLSIIYAVSIMLLALIVFQAVPELLLSFFSASDDMLSIGVPAFRIISISYIFAGFCIAMGSIFQALGKGLYSMLVSVARQLLVLIPVAYLIGVVTRDVNLFWICFPVAEIASVIVSIIFFKNIHKKIIRQMPLE